MQTIWAHIHSKGGAMEECKVIKREGLVVTVVETQAGVKCTVVDNPWNGYYADDIYGIIDEDK